MEVMSSILWAFFNGQIVDRPGGWAGSPS